MHFTLFYLHFLNPQAIYPKNLDFMGHQGFILTENKPLYLSNILHENRELRSSLRYNTLFDATLHFKVMYVTATF